MTTDNSTPLDHVDAAIAALDVEIADINARQVALADRADELGAARRDLVELRDRFPGAVPAGDPGKPQSVAPDATSARASARRSAPPKKKPAAANTATARARSNGGRKTYDLAEVARVACAAIADGRSAAKAVVAELGAASPAAASMAISKARKAGHDIPRVRSGGNGKKTQPAVTPTTHRTSDSAVLPFRRPVADDVADLEAQAGLPT